MACVTVTIAEAIVSTVVTKVVERKEKKALKEAEVQTMKYDGKELETVQTSGKIPFSRKLKWLNYMLWGGSALLVFEHVWHGEITPWFPFLTNAANPADSIEMWHEIGTTGVLMAALITAVWGGIVAVTSVIEKKKDSVSQTEN